MQPAAGIHSLTLTNTQVKERKITSKEEVWVKKTSSQGEPRPRAEDLKARYKQRKEAVSLKRNAQGNDNGNTQKEH